MAIFDLLAVLMVLAATFGWINDRYARLPITVGIMAMGLTLSLALVALSLVYPPIKVDAERLLAALNFDQLLLHGALGFLLFAGALHIELGDLREHRVSIGVLAVVGTLLSTGIVGGLCWLVTRALDLGLTPFHCLLFGALISPTDPIAVLGMLKSLGAPRHLEVQIAGESLFNDCVGVVVFLALLEYGGRPMPDAGPLALDLLVLVLREVLGGAALGLLLGLLAYWMLKRIDNYQVEILIPAAVMMGDSSSDGRLHSRRPSRRSPRDCWWQSGPGVRHVRAHAPAPRHVLGAHRRDPQRASLRAPGPGGARVAGSSRICGGGRPGHPRGAPGPVCRGGAVAPAGSYGVPPGPPNGESPPPGGARGGGPGGRAGGPRGPPARRAAGLVRVMDFLGAPFPLLDRGSGKKPLRGFVSPGGPQRG